MAIIGESKTRGLFARVVSGSVFRELTYKDVSDTEPLVSKKLPGVLDGSTNPVVVAEVTSKVQARVDDTVRIAKLLTKYQGIKWLGHNAELAAIQNNLASKRGQVTGAETRSSQNLQGILEQFWQSTVKPALIDTARLTENTLAQVAVAGTGEHFTAWYEKTYINKNAAALALSASNIAISSDNISYHQLPYVTETRPLSTLEQDRIFEAQKPGSGLNPVSKLEGVQTYGNSMTGRLSNNTAPDKTYIKQANETYSSGSFRPFGSETGVVPGAAYYVPGKSDERGPWKPEGALTLRAGTTPGAQNATDHGVHTDDPENLVPNGVNAGTRVDNGRIDLIPFWIRAITPKGDPLDDLGYLFFEANLDSYSDTYDASWQGVSYVGRADKFWTYEGFDRQISFSFRMVAHSKAHLKPIYNRLNGLLSMTAPNYGDGTFMRGTLAEITIGDLLSKQLGFIKSVGLKWETDYMWETDEGTIRVPHVLDVSIQFTPIHQFIPETRARYFKLAGDKNIGSVPYATSGTRTVWGNEPFGMFVANAEASGSYKIYDYQEQ